MTGVTGVTGVTGAIVTPTGQGAMGDRAWMLVTVLVTYLATIHNFEDMLACDVQRFARANWPWLRHVGLFGIVLVARTLQEEKDAPIALALRDAAFLYAMLVMSTKCSMRTFVPAAACLLVATGLHFMEPRADPQRRAALARARTWFRRALCAFVVAGFLLYVRKQRRDHGARFSAAEFFLSTKECRAGRVGRRRLGSGEVFAD